MVNIESRDIYGTVPDQEQPGLAPICGCIKDHLAQDHISRADSSKVSFVHQQSGSMVTIKVAEGQVSE